MSLPTPKMPLPGFRLIADDSGSYIDDVNNIRLASEFVLTRNTADPSAKISVSAYVQAQIASATAGLPVTLDDSEFSAVTSKTITIPAGVYKRIQVKLRLASGTATGGTYSLTGISATAYREVIFGQTGVAGSLTGNGSELFCMPAVGEWSGEFEIVTSREKNGFFDSWSANGGTPTQYRVFYRNADTTNDVTALVINFSGGNATGSIRVIGIP